MLKRHHVILVHDAPPEPHLLLEAATLVIGIVELRERVGELDATDVQLETLCQL